MAEKQVKVEVQDAVVNGSGKGEQITISEKSAKYYESIGYVKILDEPKKKTSSKSDSSDSE